MAILLTPICDSFRFEYLKLLVWVTMVLWFSDVAKFNDISQQIIHSIQLLHHNISHSKHFCQRLFANNSRNLLFIMFIFEDSIFTYNFLNKYSNLYQPYENRRKRSQNLILFQVKLFQRIRMRQVRRCLNKNYGLFFETVGLFGSLFIIIIYLAFDMLIIIEINFDVKYLPNVNFRLQPNSLIKQLKSTLYSHNYPFLTYSNQHSLFLYYISNGTMFKSLTSYLSQLSHSDWQVRLKAIESLQRCVQFDEDGHCLEDLNRCFPQINPQILDLRSRLSNQACQFISLCCMTYQTLLQPLIDRLVSKDSLLKLLNNGNSILAQSASQTLQTIFEHCPSDRYLNKILTQFSTSKNVHARERLAEGLKVIVQGFEMEMLSKNREALEKCIVKGVGDSSAEVRRSMREVYQVYRSRVGEGVGEGLLRRMGPSAVKAIQEQNRSEMSSLSRVQLEPFTVEIPEQRVGRIIRQPSRTQRPNNPSPPPKPRQLQQLPLNNPNLPNHNHKHPPRCSSRSNKEPAATTLTTTTQNKQDWRTDDIQFLLTKANSDNWSTRIMSFQKIHQLFLQNPPIAQPTTAKVITVFITHLQDPHIKVANFVAKSLTLFVSRFPNLCARWAPQILKACLKNYKYKESFGELLEQARRNLSFDMMPSLLQFLEQAKTVKEKTVGLDFLVQVMQGDGEVMEVRSVGMAVRIMGNLIREFYKEKAIALPALAVLSLIKERNSGMTLNALLSLGQATLDKILELAAEIQPELEGSIMRFIESVEQPKPTPPSSSSKHNKHQLQQLLSDKSKPNQCLDYLISKIKQQPKDCQQYIDLLPQLITLNPSLLTSKSFTHLFHLFHILTDQDQLFTISSLFDTVSTSLPLPVEFLHSLTTMIATAHGPHLEILLQKLTQVIAEANVDDYYKFYDQLQGLLEGLTKHLKAKEAEIRRLCVVALADLFIMLEEEEAIVEGLEQGERRLVMVYVERRRRFGGRR